MVKFQFCQDDCCWNFGKFLTGVDLVNSSNLTIVFSPFILAEIFIQTDDGAQGATVKFQLC